MMKTQKFKFIRNIKMDDVSPLPLHNEDKTSRTRALPSSSVRILRWFWCRVGYILSCRSLLPAHLCSCCSVLFLNWLIIRRVFRFVDELSCSHVCDSSEEKEELLFFFPFWLQIGCKPLDDLCAIFPVIAFLAPLYSFTAHNKVALPREKCDIKLAISFGCSGIL